eukprot:scaffold592139_cov45-Prasinocladus_malaysianus.AAC.1
MKSLCLTAPQMKVSVVVCHCACWRALASCPTAITVNTAIYRCPAKKETKTKRWAAKDQETTRATDDFCCSAGR